MRKRREEDRLGDWKRMVRKNRRGRWEKEGWEGKRRGEDWEEDEERRKGREEYSIRYNSICIII